MNIFFKLAIIVCGCGILMAWRTRVWVRRSRACLYTLAVHDQWLDARALAALTDSPRFALYPILGDLEDRCLVKSEEHAGSRERGGYPGRYYHITPKGMRETKGLP